MPAQVTETQVDGLKHEFRVVFPADDIADRVRKRLAEVQRTTRLPGFRPGKVPVDLLQRKYGAAVRAEVLEAVVGDGTQRAISERGLRPATQPAVDITAFPEGGDLEFTLSVEALPEIEAVDFSGLDLVRLRAEPDEAMVEGALARLARSRRTSEPVAEERPAAEGDLVVVDFTGRIGGEEIPGAKGERVEVELGSKWFLPGFEEHLVGAKAGETRTFTLTFPDSYPGKDLAGKEAEFTVTAHELRRPVVPALDDAFAKSLGTENLAALRTAVREQSQRELDAYARLKLKRELLDRLAERHHFPVPEGMVNGEFEAIWKRVEEDLKRGQLDPSDAGKDEDELKAEYRGIAERRVRLGLLLSEVGRSNNITVTQEELNRQIRNEALRFPGQERRVVEYYQKDPQALASLRAPIFEDKVIDFILEMAAPVERSVTPGELMAESAAEAAEGEAEAKPAAKGGGRKAAKGKGRTDEDGEGG
ncbi:MAG: trigger factor [Proteobacteria bacterium]|nr:trigger factor [Pseudomonadota bacterium]